MRSASDLLAPGAAADLQDDAAARLPVEGGDDARRRPFRQGRTRLEARRERGAGADHAGGGAPRTGTATPSERRRATMDWRRSGRPCAGHGGDRDLPGGRDGPGAVGLVVGEEDPVGRDAQLGEDLLGDAALILGVGRGGVDDVDEEVGLLDLLQRRAEGGDERVRELAKEADRVREDDRPAADAVEARVARVERREEAVLGELLRGGEPVEEGRLAGVRVADEGDGRDVAQVPAADVAARLDLLEVFLEGRDPPADLPLVELELLLAAARAEGAAAPLLGHAGLRAGEAREEVLEAGELDLRHRLAAPGARGEDGEDDVRAVEDLRRQLLLEVPGLRGGELVVEDDHARLQRLRGLDELLQLSLADVGRRVGRRALLQGAGDDDAPRRVDEALQLVEVVLGLGAARASSRKPPRGSPCSSSVGPRGPPRDRPDLSRSQPRMIPTKRPDGSERDPRPGMLPAR